MTISAKIGQREFEDVGRILWQPHYRLNKFNNYAWHRLGFLRLMGCVLVLTILSEYLTSQFHGWGRLAGIGIAIALVFGLFRHMQRPNPKLLGKVNATLPDYIDLNEQQIVVRTADGRASSYPWALARWWGRTNDVIVIEFTKSDTIVLPLAKMSTPDRGAVGEFLQARLGESKYQL